MAKDRKKIITFEDYLAETMQSDTISEKFVTSRSNWLKENKTESIIDKVPTDELPECEDIEKSKVGDFLSKKSFDLYDDDGAIWDELEDNSVMCYNLLSGNQTWWKVRKDTKSNNSKDGLVRIK